MIFGAFPILSSFDEEKDEDTHRKKNNFLNVVVTESPMGKAFMQTKRFSAFGKWNVSRDSKATLMFEAEQKIWKKASPTTAQWIILTNFSLYFKARKLKTERILIETHATFPIFYPNMIEDTGIFL